MTALILVSHGVGKIVQKAELQESSQEIQPRKKSSKVDAFEESSRLWLEHAIAMVFGRHAKRDLVYMPKALKVTIQKKNFSTIEVIHRKFCFRFLQNFCSHVCYQGIIFLVGNEK